MYAFAHMHGLTSFRVAKTGPTKAIHIPVNVLAPLFETPAYDLLTFPSDDNEFNDDETLTQDGSKLSHYATGRVGKGGQNVNWRLMGKDAPWIYSEIIFELKPDRTVATQIRTSVDKAWSETTGAVEGETAFNNLNFYKLQRNLQTDEYEFARQELLLMEGELEPFINSASGQRPEPPIPPSLQ